MIKIMFTCHSNVCRSPVAEFVLKHKIKKLGLDDRFYIESSACTYDDIGRPIYPDSKKSLIDHGILDGIEEKRSIKLMPDMYDKFDLFIGMDDENIRDMNNIFKGDPDKKIYKMKEFIDDDSDVEDPWYTEQFIKAYEDIDVCTDAIIEKFKK